MVVLSGTATISDTPGEGSSPSVGDTIGSSNVAFTGSGSSFTDTGLTNGTQYFYRIFSKDLNGNYSTPGVEVSGTPGLFGTGTIQGRVTDADTGRGLRNVVVQIVETGRSVTTKGNGRYTLSDVPAGDYTVTAFKTGYAVGPVGELITVSTNETSVQDFTLEPG